ncbi:zinc finger, CCHC-type containing protein [Tanacetum coccineum]|uniref:Zinc finger, CCHC-type containing protein n=1 Tax=Tanacetum coccineum TaxID=301880 RepID=A0ABQ5C884_9ASTR
MHFLLTTLKVVYVLSAFMPEFVEDETLEQTRKRCKWENDDYICRGHILNGMSDALFDVFQNVGSTKELWDQIESKYMAENASSKKFLVSNFNNYKMVDSSIIDKLPPSWKDFKHTLKHNKDELSLVQLGSHFRIEETLRAEESVKGKGKEIDGSSSVYMIEDGKNKNNNKNTKGKKRNSDGNNDGSNKKSKLTCWKCGKTSHFKKNCRVKKNNGGNTFGSGQGSKDPNSSQEPNEYISINSVIESRDVMFDEKRFTSIPRPKSLMPSSNEDQIGKTPSVTPTTRRSNRARVAKSFGSDFQLYLVEGSKDKIGPQYSYCYGIEEDPRMFDEAM